MLNWWWSTVDWQWSVYWLPVDPPTPIFLPPFKPLRRGREGKTNVANRLEPWAKMATGPMNNRPGHITGIKASIVSQRYYIPKIKFSTHILCACNNRSIIIDLIKRDTWVRRRTSKGQRAPVTCARIALHAGFLKKLWDRGPGSSRSGRHKTYRLNTRRKMARPVNFATGPAKPQHSNLRNDRDRTLW